MNSPTRPAAVIAPVAGVSSVPAPKRDGDAGAVNPGYSMPRETVDRDQRADPAFVTVAVVSRAVRELAEDLVDDARLRLRQTPRKTKGPPPGRHQPQASRNGRIGKSRSPWRFGIPHAKRPPKPDWLK